MTLHKPSIRLAGLYLAIMMAVSLFFSINLYQVSVQEFDRGLRGPLTGFRRQLGSPQSGTVTIMEQLLADGEAQYQAAKQRVMTRLITINLLIMVGGGALCYVLARRTLQPIEEAHDAQSRFTADASHELRTPIAAMRAETEVALMDPKLSLEQAKQRLQSNLEELDKLSSLSNGLLKLARLEKSEFLRERVELKEVLRSSVDRLLPLAEAKSILIALPEDIADAQVAGDKESLIEALVVILDNAVKYSPEKSEVSVRLDKGRRHADIQVRDHGIGIKASELPHIFERFYRADTARSKQHIDGYGLGLAIAKNIVEIHGGTIAAESRPGKGTTFTVQLPLVS